MTIANLRQRKVTASWLAEFEVKLIDLQATATVGHRLALLQTQSYIDAFRAQLGEVERLGEPFLSSPRTRSGFR